MDGARAKRFIEDLTNTEVGGWRINKFLGNGKSAIVFAAEKDDQKAALKIFDPELIERFGKEAQLERISRELELVGHDNPNLIQIFDGGECDQSGFLYIAMEMIEWPSLEQVIPDVPKEKIWTIIESVASAAEYLEQHGLAHRDIKPSNIIIDDSSFNAIKLLDLGVMRPIGTSDLTDGSEKPFIGTLRYSSPEFLMRTEEDTVEGWRAITFYQMGGVLHDLIMGVRIFDDYSEPYPQLVHAVREVKPNIEAPDVDSELIFLAKNCLTKDFHTRLDLVTWEDFRKPEPKDDEAASLKKRIRRRRIAAKADIDPFSDNENRAEKRSVIQDASKVFEKIEEISRNLVVSTDIIPPAKFTNSPDFDSLNGMFVVLFRSNREYALPIDLSILFQIEIVDIKEKIIKINGLACAGNEIVFDNNNSIELFNGVFDEKVIHDSLEHLLLRSLDNAQQTNPGAIKEGEAKIIVGKGVD